MGKIDVIGVPIDLGASRRGVDMGPSAIRYAGLKNKIKEMGKECNDLGNIDVKVPECNSFKNDCQLKYWEEIAEVNAKLFDMTAKSVARGHFPLILGGDHSISAGSVLGVQSVRKNIGVIWVDAHGDFNNLDTSPSGNLHGMSLAACTGYGPKEMVPFKPNDVNFVNPDKTVLIGARCLDEGEKVLLREAGVHVFTMMDIDMYGMRDIMKKAIDIVENGTEGFHLSFDLDAVTPYDAPGVGTPVPGGLTYREANLATELISDSKKLVSAEFVELNPIIDGRNVTGVLAVTLITSVLGKKIF